MSNVSAYLESYQTTDASTRLTTSPPNRTRSLVLMSRSRGLNNATVHLPRQTQRKSPFLHSARQHVVMLIIARYAESVNHFGFHLLLVDKTTIPWHEA